MPKRPAELLVELTDNVVKIRKGDKVLTLPQASAPENAEEMADFIVALDDIAHWDPPFEADEIDIAMLQKIVHAIEEEFDKQGLAVAFE